MADDTGSESPSEQKELQTTDATDKAEKSKRRLRPSPTVREQSEKAAAKAAAPRKRGIISTVLGAPFRLIAWILRPVFRFLNRFKPFRFIGYIFVPPFIRNAWRELRQVTWPNFRQTRQLTFAVLVFSIIFGAIVAAVDWGLDKIFRAVVLN